MNLRSLTPRTLAALLVLMTLAAYLPAIHAGYIWDDDTLLTANPQMRSTDGLAQIWHGDNSRDYTPLTLSGFWLEWQLWGDNPAGYHIVNILLHALSAVLLWLILARLRVPGAWLGALLFAIHPVNVASVAWIAELKNTLSAALFLGSILAWLAWRENNRTGLYLGSLALFILAALSKGAVVTLPAVLLLCLLWQDRKVSRADMLRLIPYGVIALAAALLTILYQARAPHYGLLPDSIGYRVSRAGADIWFYLGALFWPVGLSPMRPPWLPGLHSLLAWVPGLGAAAVFAVLFWKRRSWGRPLLFGYACYLVMLLPVLGFVWMALMQQTPGTDWWQYLAAPGIFACVGAGVAMASQRWRFVTPLAGIALALLMVQTWRRAAIYESMETYCRAVTAEDPHAWTLQNNLGIMLRRDGRPAESEACFHQALEDNPGYVEARINLGNTLAIAGDATAAEAEYRKAAQMRPGDPASLGALASLLTREGRTGEALSFQAAAVQADPRNVASLVKLAQMLAGSGRYADAAACFRDASALAPENVSIRIGLCEALIAAGKHDDALRVCWDVDQIAHESGDTGIIEVAAKLRRDCGPSGSP